MRFPVLSSYPGSTIVCPSCRSPDGSCALATVTPVVPIATKRMNTSFDCIANDLRNHVSISFSPGLVWMEPTIPLSRSRGQTIQVQAAPDHGARKHCSLVGACGRETSPGGHSCFVCCVRPRG